MKKALFLALSLAFLLTACGETTLPDTSEQNPVDNTQETSLPENCLLYYDLGNVSILAEDKSLPLAQNAGDGYATSYSVWYDGEYQDLALQDGDSGISVADMTGGSAVFDYGAGLVVWNGERYHCAHLTAQDSYIPNISPNIPGGILLLEVSGDCWADGGTADVACFTGFGTVVICGSGTLRIAGAVIGQTCCVRHHDGRKRLPALPAERIRAGRPHRRRRADRARALISAPIKYSKKRGTLTRPSLFVPFFTFRTAARGSRPQGAAPRRGPRRRQSGTHTALSS